MVYKPAWNPSYSINGALECQMFLQAITDGLRGGRHPKENVKGLVDQLAKVKCIHKEGLGKKKSP